MALSPLIPKRGMAEDSSCSLHLHQPSLHRTTLNLHPNSESCVLVFWGQAIGEIVTSRSLDWTTPLVVCCWNPSQCFPKMATTYHSTPRSFSKFASSVSLQLLREVSQLCPTSMLSLLRINSVYSGFGTSIRRSLLLMCLSLAVELGLDHPVFQDGISPLGRMTYWVISTSCCYSIISLILRFGHRNERGIQQQGA